MTENIIGVTGATGFIGRNLTPVLISRGHRIRAIVRNPGKIENRNFEVRQADLLNRSSLVSAFEGVHMVYYLIHSMSSTPSQSFIETDRAAAENFLWAAEKTGVNRIIYLGGLGETGPGLSEHLKSRAEVGKILQSGGVQTTILRAAIILGPNGASWEMLRQLVEKLPIMITPRWVETKCQPIALRDTLQYLARCVDNEATAGNSFDIGGPDILTYRKMMLKLAEIIGKRRLIYGIPVLTPNLSSYWVDLVTDIPSTLAHPLIEGLKNEVICRENKIRSIIPIELTPYIKAIKLALDGKI